MNGDVVIAPPNQKQLGISMSTAIDYGFSIGDRVYHIKDSSLVGVVTAIDSDFDLGGITTCEVLWDDSLVDLTDVQWTNKLQKQ